jgi:arylsulfatase A-like enzyme
MSQSHILHFLFLAALVGNSSATAAPNPNILVILTDDQGYADLGCQGSVKDIRTPHIDALAASGVRCTAGYITAPQCSPSRAGLLTGRYQARFGVEEIAQCPLPLEEVTLAERLKPAGYRTGFVGKWHLDVNPLCVMPWGQGLKATTRPATRAFHRRFPRPQPMSG